ncbi:hypothetical protein P691DRAFT_769728 [Macrolepiota fuliginosa MF-IS2]|uniref:Uncharacterized protein n=1 Tax=Macrolepiota fuliginosa MF-IS2 TaxID=1400762 RepID=A0A9P5WXE9_9AGAR|nr:hypothetical protein P691DRAFT_769728 [Macrolepiota fuliginosa MF-IS2]
MTDFIDFMKANPRAFAFNSAPSGIGGLLRIDAYGDLRAWASLTLPKPCWESPSVHIGVHLGRNLLALHRADWVRSVGLVWAGWWLGSIWWSTAYFGHAALAIASTAGRVPGPRWLSLWGDRVKCILLS